MFIPFLISALGSFLSLWHFACHVLVRPLWPCSVLVAYPDAKRFVLATVLFIMNIPMLWGLFI